MNLNLEDFRKIVNAEDYFEFFQLPYDAKIVNVNRLHILKKFSQLMQEIDENNPNISHEEKLSQYRSALENSYQVFLESTAQEEKLFKVFNQKPKNVVMLTEITSD
ncbi:MAG: nitrogenase-stabilizing/protective protein NifW [Scytonematopsis contorta HA4267-MV1]|jgi:nitrogenase-stabilizing/protective protein|nr:nitrogenase-stabilizing/protective protein NifW [Scytonematopsis contorta HA4267-MV1]